MKKKIELRNIDEYRELDIYINIDNHFSITGDYILIGSENDPEDINCKGDIDGGGCIHDEILKYKPELKLFVDIHLSDLNGVPMHAIANSWYHLHNTSFEVFRDYIRVSDKQAKRLAKCKDKDSYTRKLVRMGIFRQWKREARKAIKMYNAIN